MLSKQLLSQRNLNDLVGFATFTKKKAKLLDVSIPPIALAFSTKDNEFAMQSDSSVDRRKHPICIVLSNSIGDGKYGWVENER